MLVSLFANARLLAIPGGFRFWIRTIACTQAFFASALTNGACSFTQAKPEPSPPPGCVAEGEPEARQKTDSPIIVNVAEGWSKWRGAKGDAQVDGLPTTWTTPERLWRIPLDSNGVGGAAISQEIVVVSSRDLLDKADRFIAMDAQTGIEIFRHEYPSLLNLDYGNSPRATPLILDDHIVTLGAGGDLFVLDLETGKPVWSKHLVKDLGGKMPAWGYSASPIVFEQTLIVHAGGPNSALVALELETGDEVWKSPGRLAAYSSPLLVIQHGIPKLIGSDEKSFGAWNAKDGRRLWELKLPIDRDFNVPSPLMLDDRLFIVSENNGAMLYRPPHALDEPRTTFTSAELLAQSDELSHDANSPVRVGKYVAGVHEGLVLLDPDRGLAMADRWDDPSLYSYASMIVDEDRILVTCCDGSVILVQVMDGKIRELGRMQCEESKGDLLAHAAFDQGILIVRGPSWIDAYRW